jgi:hypothetical protein
MIVIVHQNIAVDQDAVSLMIILQNPEKPDPV